MELYAVLDNQEHNQERDHIAAMPEQERLEWACQESMEVHQQLNFNGFLRGREFLHLYVESVQ